MINNKLLKTNLNNRNILITGASGNLGKNFYKYLDTLGANLIICDVDNDKKIPPLKKNHFFFKLDVTKKKQWINLKKNYIKKKFSSIL